MHELGVVFKVIDLVEEVAVENKLSHIHSVTIELGEVSTVIDSYLQNCWKWAVGREELTKDAILVVEQIPALNECMDCGGVFGTVEYGKKCPICESTNTFLLQGNEFNVKEIEGE